ncbi:MAG: hypothetical protein LQ347_001720 [Umbilicaria vellea]|nr:MAG: hypothetical protein LQ347_001720 [Umbilicaria vellea]
MVQLRPRKVVRASETPAQRGRTMVTAQISSSWGAKQRPPLPSKGMRNPGQLCYRNGVLQAVLHIPKFVNWIENVHPVCSVPPVPNCVACALHRLSTVYWGVGSIQPALTHFWTVAQQAGWQHTGQSDADQFYLWLLGTLQTQLQAEQFRLDALLSIDIKSSLLCPVCQQPSDRVTPEYSYGVTLPNDADSQLAERIRASFATEQVHNVHCANQACLDHSPRDRRLSIDAAPDVLCIQLRRFIFTQNADGTFSSRKNNHRVAFGQFLDLSEYLEGHKQGSGALRYRLVAVVQQIGGLNSGHYVTMARGTQRKWREMNDAVVTGVRQPAVLDPLKHGNSDNHITPYLLFWERIDKVVADI